ncbi:hypothetical protein [Microbispora sp. NPDC049125]|uniref:hypothetical protein n=1 Tax=Microbispora sp. NPDC049125 TaxID=3154929 RepID=UPI003467B969
MTETKRPLLSADSIGAIADITRSTADAERVLGAAGITLKRKPATRHEGTVIIPSTSSHVSSTLRDLDPTDVRW